MNEFIRVQREPDRVEIAVAVVTWNSQIPATDWRVARRLPAEATDAEVADAVRSVLADGRYFATCKECGARLPCGMTTSLNRNQRKVTLCHGCAQKHGMVF